MRTSWYPQVEMEHQHGKIQFFFIIILKNIVAMQLIYKFNIRQVCVSVIWRPLVDDTFLNLYLLDSRKGPYITRNKVTISIEKAEIGKFTVSILYIHRSSDY